MHTEHHPTSQVHLVPPDELARSLGVSRSMIYKLIRQGLPTISIGRARRIDPAEAVAWLREHSDAA